MVNRTILADMVGEDYNVIESCDGAEGMYQLRKFASAISIILLDYVMPVMNGFEMLGAMKAEGYDDIPVIMISSQQAPDFVERAYELGVADFIARPFDPNVVFHRIANTLFLFSKQRMLQDLVVEQVARRQRDMNLMVSVLSHVVEFRNGESGPHVINVRAVTEMLLMEYIEMWPECGLTAEDVSIIGLASGLHDIGKITIPESILNKPGRLTPEEFAIMKTHCVIGAAMLNDIPGMKDERLVSYAHDICRWHHERYDGRGYPDGLMGDETPIYAQAVAVADVYDALVSTRVYKQAYSHAESLEMIFDGQCGQFNPKLLKCLEAVAPRLERKLAGATVMGLQDSMIERSLERRLDASLKAPQGPPAPSRVDFELSKQSFFDSLSREVRFEYNIDSHMLEISSYGAELLGLRRVISHPSTSPELLEICGQENMALVVDALRTSTPTHTDFDFDMQLNVKGEARWYHVFARALWTFGRNTRYEGAIGKLVDIHESRKHVEDLQYRATHDSLTRIMNRARATEVICERLAAEPKGVAMLMLIDIDRFKEINDTQGHIFGDRVLEYFAECLKRCVREDDVICRFGGDEFMVFIETTKAFDPIVKRLHEEVEGELDGVKIEISMGVACSNCCGRDYDTLLSYADEALYAAKRAGRSGMAYCGRGTNPLTMPHSLDSGFSRSWKTLKQHTDDFVAPVFSQKEAGQARTMHDCTCVAQETFLEFEGRQ